MIGQNVPRAFRLAHAMCSRTIGSTADGRSLSCSSSAATASGSPLLPIATATLRRRAASLARIFSTIHAEDAGRAVARSVDDAEGGAVYNVADDRPMPMGDLVGLIARLTGAPEPSRIPALLARAVVGNDVVTLLTTSVRLSNRAIKQDLELTFRYPTPEEGLRAVLGEPVPDPD